MNHFPVRHGTIDEHSVKAIGAKIVGDGAGISINGWTITTDKAPIAGDQDLESLKSHLTAPNLPEQVYSRNSLSLSHLPSGLCLTFTAKDALQSWMNDESAPVHVEAASSWQETRREDMKAQNAKVLDYDWTFTTNYEGSSSSCHFTTINDISSLAPWIPVSEPPDRSALLARDPILLWDEVPLYESELEDNGSSQLLVKVRVMPRCWLVLMRYYLRVDGVIVRMRETRYFTTWDNDNDISGGGGGDKKVYKEVKWHEGTPTSMKHWGLCMEHHRHHGGRDGGGRGRGSVWTEGDSAVNAFQAVAPCGVVKYCLYSLKL